MKVEKPAGIAIETKALVKRYNKDVLALDGTPLRRIRSIRCLDQTGREKPPLYPF